MKQNQLLFLPLAFSLFFLLFLFWNQQNVDTINLDVCGVVGGDGSSCAGSIEYSGSNPRLLQLFDDYIKIHHMIMDPNDNSVEKRYVVLDDYADAGLGNRFQTMVSTFLFAMLSQRAFLIDWPELSVTEHWNKEESIAMPNINKLLVSPGFDWDYAAHRHMDVFRCEKQKDYHIGEQSYYTCCNELIQVEVRGKIIDVRCFTLYFLEIRWLSELYSIYRN